MKLKHISVEIRIIISLLFFILFNISSFSQTNLQKSSPLIFVEGGERKTFSSVEENIKSFGLDHTNSMIAAYNTKLESIDTNDVNNKVWVKLITYELDILRLLKLEFTK